MKQEELNSILELHRKWLYGEEGGKRADLRGADLSRADLSRADLRDADLRGADLYGGKNAALAQAQTVICPEGQIIGYKKIRCFDNDGDIVPAIAKLLIPGDAKRSNASGRKCRASKAIVLDITREGEQITRGFSIYDAFFDYEAGKTVYPAGPFNDDRWEECASGIHFYITREEAANN